MAPLFRIPPTNPLPPSPGHLLTLRHPPHIQPHHRLPQPFADLRQHARVLEMRHGLHDGVGPLGRVAALEDAAADEDAVASELHHQRRVRRRRHASGRKVDDGQASQCRRLLEEVVRRVELLCEAPQLHVAHPPRPVDLRRHGPHVPDRLHDVSRSGLPFRPDHRGPLVDPPEGLPQVPAPAHKRRREAVLLHVEGLVRGGQDLALVNVVDAELLQDLAFDEVADARFGHDGYGYGVHDFLDECGVRHAGDAALGADVGRDALEGHDGAGAGFFGDAGLGGVDDVHDDAAFEHFR